tara:strand:+ start:1897 stop:2559 length:663 start_codon:yes stop_codon:yes gene_type:complete
MGFQRLSGTASKDSKNSALYENLTEGEHEARLVYVADCGLQAREYMGEVKPPAQQIALCLEIIGESVTIDGIVQPRIIWTKPFNIFGRMDSKSTEYKMYRAFVTQAKEDTVADWEVVLGSPVNVIIKHHKKDEETTYDNVDGLVAIPQKYASNVGPALTADISIAGSEDEGSAPIRNLFGLAKYVHDKRLTDGGTPPTPKAVSNAKPVATEESFDSDVPF